jgi:hypothetical protein
MIRFLAGTTDFCFLHKIQIVSGTRPASYPMCTGDSFPEGAIPRLPTPIHGLMLTVILHSVITWWKHEVLCQDWR